MNLCFWKSKFRIDAMAGPSGSWYWNLISAGNNEILAVSETYSSKDACLTTALKVAEALNCPLRALESLEQMGGPALVGELRTWIIHRE